MFMFIHGRDMQHIKGVYYTIKKMMGKQSAVKLKSIREKWKM